MAEEKILIDVELDTSKLAQEVGQATQKLEILKGEQKRLNEEFEKGKISSEEYGKSMASVKQGMEEANRAIKSKTGLLQAANIEEVKNTQSLEEQRQALNTLQKAYASLSGDEKKAADAKGGLRDKIKQLSDSVKEQESAIGDARRNVGNYVEALKTAGVGIDGFIGKMKAFLANPWALVIAAIVTAIKGLVDAFKSSEARMRELQSAFAPIRAAVDVVKQGFDALAKTLSVLVVGAISKVADGITWLAKQIDKIGQKFGKNFGLSEALEQNKKNTEALAKTEQAYADHKRKFVVEQAKLESEISNLRLQAAAKDKVSAEERIKLLEQAASRERTIYAEKKKLAEENLAILRMQAAESENDAETNDRLAEAEAAVILADKELADKNRELTAQIAEAKNSIKGKTEAVKEETAVEEQAVDNTEELTNRRLQLERELREKLISLIEDDTERALTEEELRHEDEMMRLQERYQELGDTEVEAKQAINAMLEAEDETHRQKTAAIQAQMTEDVKKQLAARQAQAQANAAAIGGTLGAMSNLLGQFGEQSKEAAIASKVLSLGEIAVNTGVAIAKGVAQAQSVPFPANIAAIATTVATIIANIASAISTVKSAKFASGGIIEGNYNDGDVVSAKLSGGEMVLNPSQQTQLFNLANGATASGLNYDLLASKVAEANRSLPSPTVVYSEFNDFTGNVARYQEEAKI